MGGYPTSYHDSPLSIWRTIRDWMPDFNLRVDLGHIITLAILLLSGAVVYGSMKADIDYIKSEVIKLEDVPERLTRLETYREIDRQSLQQIKQNTKERANGSQR